jgi:hypothetical protein
VFAQAYSAINGTYNASSGNPVIIGWSKPYSGTPTYSITSSTDLSVLPSAATATWQNKDGKTGIEYANGTNKGFIEIEGVNISLVISYELTLNDGVSGKKRYEAGEIVTIIAEPPEGKVFDKWTSTDGITFANANQGNTTFTMPAKAVTVTATFKDLPPGEYIILTGDYAILENKNGNGTVNANVNSAKAGAQITLTVKPNAGYAFKEWVVVRGGVTIANNKFTMPAELVVVMAVFEADGTDPIRTPQIAGSANSILAYAKGNSIVLQNLPANARVEVFGLNGKLVYSNRENPSIGGNGVQTIDVHAKGMYIVKTGTQIFRVAVK